MFDHKINRKSEAVLLRAEYNLRNVQNTILLLAFSFSIICSLYIIASPVFYYFSCITEFYTIVKILTCIASN